MPSFTIIRSTFIATAARLISNLDLPVTALTYRSGKIYGISDGDGTDYLVAIDPTTGTLTTVGALNLPFDLGDSGLDFATDGMLYGIGEDRGDEESDDDDRGVIFTVNPNTGAATEVASTLVGFESLATVAPVPEPASTLSLLLFGAFGASSIFQRKQRK